MIYRKKFPIFIKDRRYSDFEFSTYIPVTYNYVGASKFINAFLFIINRFSTNTKIFDLIKCEKPDVIHFNSLVLIPLIKSVANNEDFKNIKLVCHVRESAFRRLHKTYISTLSLISVFICIDKITKDCLITVYPFLKNKVITILPNLAEQNTHKNILVRKKISTFGYIGAINSNKGALFIARAFKQAKKSSIRLIILGNGFTLEHLCLKLLTVRNSNISLMGFKRNLLESEIYDSLDVIIRGETWFAGLGRSGFEAINSGKILLLPDPSGVLPPELLTNNSPIRGYRPRNIDSLQSEIFSLHGRSLEEFNFGDILKIENSFSSIDRNKYLSGLNIVYKNKKII